MSKEEWIGWATDYMKKSHPYVLHVLPSWVEFYVHTCERDWDYRGVIGDRIPGVYKEWLKWHVYSSRQKDLYEAAVKYYMSQHGDHSKHVEFGQWCVQWSLTHSGRVAHLSWRFRKFQEGATVSEAAPEENTKYVRADLKDNIQIGNHFYTGTFKVEKLPERPEKEVFTDFELHITEE